MTVIGRAVHPALFQQFSAQVKELKLGCQFINVGKLQTPATLSADNIAAVTEIYNAITTAAASMERVAELDQDRLEMQRRYNRAVIRNANKGFFGRRGQQAFTK